MYDKRCKNCESLLEDESKELCNFCESLINNKNNKSTTKEKRKIIKVVEKIHILKLTCIMCKKIWPIRATKPELYTEEIKNNWKCVLCDCKSKKEER